MKKRKYISWKTRCASALLALGRIPYSDAKLMTEAQFLSLWNFDHNILHSSGHEDADRYWNLAPMLLRAHREKTKADAKVVAKSNRIQVKDRLAHIDGRIARGETLGLEEQEFLWKHHPRSQRRKLRSRGFDKRYRKKMDGTVVPR